MSERTGWDRGLSVRADGKGLVGHAGVVLLRRLADRSGLTQALAGVFPQGGVGWRDRAVVLVHLAISIALGTRSVLEAEHLALHQVRLTGPGASDSTVHRTLETLDHQPGRLAHHARRRYLRLDPTWPWTSAFTLAWTRITDLAAVT
ncbi:hypothetical protein [Streptomyces halstedii]|uniref:hypothetical protein n=1 Tax=Streptomyces halstedii TaxID=1944 RepID=UPI00334A27B8